MFKFIKRTAILGILALFIIACGGAETPEPTPEPEPTEVEEVAEEMEEEEEMAEEEEPAMMAEADLDAVKSYAVGNAANQKAGAEQLLGAAMRYYQLVSEAGFDYEAALASSPRGEIQGLIAAAQAAWLATSEAYELNEGIVAGTPELVYYDVLIDAGASAAEDPEEALEWNLNLPDGTVLESPGNYFHSLLEQNLFGSNPDYVGGVVDGIVMPEANLMLGAATGLDEASGKLVDSIDAWEPTLEDAFTAMVVMTPTMNEYFEQWKLSSFVSGDSAEEAAFVGQSRLFDVVNILNGLNVTYDNVAALVEESDSDLDGQIADGYTDLRAFVGDLYDQELDGKVFTPEEADLFGTEAQDKATAISGQVAQAAAQLSIAVDEEFDMIVPGSATVDQGLAEAPMMDDSMEMSDAGTIAEVAVEAGVFNTLVTALTEADLAGTFADPDAGPFTVFAPTDDAFAALPEGTIEELLADPTGALTDILLYHVAEGAVDAATVVTLDSATTLGGQDVTIEVVDGGVVLNGSVNVVTTDIKASNGIIHIIDAVLIPDANASSAAAVECEDGQRLVEHAGGETCIPEDPQRIAVAGDRHVSETLIAMGIEPVAITNWDEIPEFVQAEFSDFEAVVNLGGNWEPNLEALVEVGPDLIITHGDDFYDSLSLIAPTVKINSPYEGVEGLVTDVGAIFGDEQTDVLLALLDDAVETVTCAVDNPEEITVSIIDHFNGGIGLNTTIPWNTSAFLIQEAGFSIPDAHVAEEISDLRGLSLERLDTLEDAEVLFVLRYFLEDENPETLLESPLWQSLEVVQSGNVLDGNFRWWSVGGPLATQRTAEEMVAGLIDFGLATPCEDSATVECEAGQRLFDNELLATDPVCIPENPQRIVALAPAPFEVMLALGETPPVGAIGYLESIYQRNFPYTNDTAAEVTFVGFPANLELVVELEPDLIIQSPFGQEDIEQVQEIAPTVVLPQLPNVRWEENMMFTADILNKTAEVEALITDYNERVDTLRDLIGDPSAIEISVVRYYNDGGAPGLQLQLANAFSTDMLADIGFARPESQAYTAEEATEVYGGAVAATLSLEQLPLVDGEYLFAWSQAPDAEGDAANEGAWAQLSEDPLWGTLQAVQNGQNYQVGGHWVGWGFHAAHEVLDDLFVQVAGVDPAEVSPNPFAE